ncbi:hypothetical protein ALON55S_01817 [Alishewanella longhuensis]
MALIYISVGSNIDRDVNIRGGVRAMAEHFGALTLSSVYESEAVGFTGDPFYNMVVAAETDLAIDDCVALLKHIEEQFGRLRGAGKVLWPYAGSGFADLRSTDLSATG